MGKEPFIYVLLCNTPQQNLLVWKDNDLLFITVLWLNVFSWPILLGLPSASQRNAEVFHVATFSWNLAGTENPKMVSHPPEPLPTWLITKSSTNFPKAWQLTSK